MQAIMLACSLKELMKDYICIGSTPAEESCFGVNHPLARAETLIYQRQLKREFPKANFVVKGFNHDFGMYYEVVAVYDEDNEDEVVAAYDAENNAAPNWDAVAIAEWKKLTKETPV